MTKVGAVIVAYNNKEMLRSLILDLGSQVRKPDEVIVVDNGSVDGTALMMGNEFSAVRYIRFEKNKGSAGGFREGIKIACEQNDLIWLFDDDVSVDREALYILLDRLETLNKKEKIGAVRSGGSSYAGLSGPQKNSSFAWRGTLLSSEMVKEIGLPRVDYFLYGDDTEYAMRMAGRGYALYCIPESRVLEKRRTDKIIFSMAGMHPVIYKDAFRIYYAHRNQINISLEYSYGLKIIIFFMFLKRSEALRYAGAVIDGVNDGFAGRLGENPKYLP
jgi:rhamnopyranosyl-N-acetylglucosaminyl-diphospho-decaprenol beta-1,3/1,4-galactofuranosyltransferase